MTKKNIKELIRESKLKSFTVYGNFSNGFVKVIAETEKEAVEKARGKNENK
jgi:hypothetical protein